MLVTPCQKSGMLCGQNVNQHRTTHSGITLPNDRFDSQSNNITLTRKKFPTYILPNKENILLTPRVAYQLRLLRAQARNEFTIAWII